MLKPADLFDLTQTEHAAIFAGCEYPWEALRQLAAYLAANLRPALHNRCEGVAYVGERVFIGQGTLVEDIVGNSCEVKNSLLFNHAVAAHFNYVGDSILGHKAHVGAGTKISNFKLAGGNISVEIEGRRLDTGLRKFGALLGDHTEVGCNAVLNPGSIIGRRSVLYPNVNWRGILPADMIVKNKGGQEIVARRTD